MKPAMKTPTKSKTDSAPIGDHLLTLREAAEELRLSTDLKRRRSQLTCREV